MLNREREIEEREGRERKRDSEAQRCVLDMRVTSFRSPVISKRAE